MEECPACGEATPTSVTMDVYLPDGAPTRRECLDINSLVREETQRILKDANLKLKPAVTFVIEASGKEILLDQKVPWVDYLKHLAQGGSKVVIRRN